MNEEERKKNIAALFVGPLILFCIIWFIYNWLSPLWTYNKVNQNPCVSTSKDVQTIVDGEVTDTETVYGCQTNDGTFYPEVDRF